MQATVARQEPSGSPAPNPVRAAFIELHGRSLHGFALLMALGDRQRAAALTTAALSAGLAQVESLRHPERAAAWLRSQVRAGLPARSPRPGVAADALADLGADAGVVAGLAVLDPRRRAALIASTIERLDRSDVATIVGRDGARLQRLLAEARSRYVAAYRRALPAPSAHGPITDRLTEVARQTVG